MGSIPAMLPECLSTLYTYIRVLRNHRDQMVYTTGFVKRDGEFGYFAAVEAGLFLLFWDQIAAIRAFRAYHNQALSWPTNFRLGRRANLYRYFSQTLSSCYKSLEYQNGAGGAPRAIGEHLQLHPTALCLEVAQIHASWEDSLYAITAFPRADQKNWRVLVMIEQIMEDHKVLGSSSEADKRALVETIYRASQKTFQSPRILRLLFFALIEMGQYDEAELALKSYMEMAELNLKVKNAAANETLSYEQRVRLDVESQYEITTVMIAGSVLYGKELNKPTEALTCASNALDNVHKYLQSHESTSELLNSAYKYQGIAYGLLASSEHEPEKRSDFYAKAIESLAKSIQILPAAFDGHYLLALQLAEMRDIPKATMTAKQSLSINPSYIPSWHLLALLLSSQKDYERALNICAVGLKESEWDITQADGYSASGLDGEEYLSFCITQALLHDKVHGPEAALEPHEALFVLYSKVFAIEPEPTAESLYGVNSIQRRDQSELDVSTGSTIVGRLHAGSILSIRDVPKPSYTPSIASIGSTTSKDRRIPPSATSAQSTLIKSALSLPSVAQRPTTKSIMRIARANTVLVTLWLLSASIFRRLGRMEDALKAIEEAERVDSSNPDVWYQLGLLYAAQGDPETASVSFSKALAISPYHSACLARVGRSYLDAGSLDMAEYVLETTTKSHGWDCAEAWLYLGRVMEASDRLTRAKECLWYALDLENS